MAEGDAAIHAARGLLAEAVFFEVLVELVPVADAAKGVAVEGDLADELDESSGLAHVLVWS